MNKHLLLLLAVLLLLSACKKDITPTTGSATTETIGSITVKNLDFNYLSAKSQIELNDRGNQLASGISLRVRKDSVIWISVQPGLGIEAARMKMTQDSVYLMNRLQREYTATDYTFLSSRFNMDINFKVLQAILLGNYQAQGAEKVITQGNEQQIQQARQNLILDYFIGRQNQKLQQLHILDRLNGNSITVRYDNFQDVGATPFAYLLEAKVAQKGQLSEFKIMHNRVALTDETLDFPFTVPTGYKRLPAN